MSSRLLLLASLRFSLLHAVQFTAGQTFQITLSGVLDLSKPLVPDVSTYDLDMYDTSASIISQLTQQLKKTVICYFSAGTYEDWRADAAQFKSSDLGLALPEWKGERWLDIRSANVKSIMEARIKMAASKGCHAIDPDNTDGYDNKNGLGLTQADTVTYVKWLASTAAKYNLKIGLKNSMAVLPSVQNIVDFAVNEECAAYKECDTYASFLAMKKPVFHIEYPKKAPTVSATEKTTFCQDSGPGRMSTVLKDMDLDGWVQFCDGTSATTQITKTNSKPSNDDSGNDSDDDDNDDDDDNTPAPAPAPAKPAPKPSSTLVTVGKSNPTPPAKTSSTSTRQSTPTPATCSVQKGRKCGGRGFTGCTVCAAGSACKVVNTNLAVCR